MLPNPQRGSTPARALSFPAAMAWAEWKNSAPELEQLPRDELKSPEAEISGAPDIKEIPESRLFTAARVRLSTGKVIHSIRNPTVPPAGTPPGP